MLKDDFIMVIFKYYVPPIPFVNEYLYHFIFSLGRAFTWSQYSWSALSNTFLTYCSSLLSAVVSAGWDHWCFGYVALCPGFCVTAAEASGEATAKASKARERVMRTFWVN